MSVKQPVEVAQYLKGKKDVLLLTGALCDEMELDGKKLIDYAADLAKALNAPVAATANTVVGLKARGVTTAAKKYAAEIVDYMRSPWHEPIMKNKPAALVFIGYNPVVAKGLTSMVKDADTVMLGNVCIEEATYSLPDASPSQYQRNLTDLIKAL